MPFSKRSALAGVIAFVTRVAAHGTVTGIVADGIYYQGYRPSFQFQNPPPVVVGWTAQNLDNGFVAPAAFGNPDIICHKGATNAQTSATVKAGGTVELQWTAWPESHHGPVIDYLASCNGGCTTVDKTTLKFFKVDGVGLNEGSAPPGNWASDTLIANNNSWTVTIPSDIAPGGYVLRHEIIALHSSGDVNGAQNYPQCINLEVTGSGTVTPPGTLGTDLYTETDPGILINIYRVLASYIVPGPPLYDGAANPSQSPAASMPATSSAATGVSSVPSVTSSAQNVVTPAPAIGGATSSPIFTRFLNSTSPTGRPGPSKTRTGRPTRRPKPTSSPVTIIPTPVAIASTTVVVVEETVVPTVTVPPSVAPLLPVESTFPTSAPAPTPPTSTLPEGTTLNDVLAWIASFYGKYGKGSYTSAAVARRHARDVAAIAAKREAFDRSGGLDAEMFGGR